MSKATKQASLNPKVDGYIGRAKKWQEEMKKLRAILLGAGLTEELKWGKPCYTHRDSNVVVMMGFKEHCGLVFAKGALLKDPQGLLIQPTEHTQAARQFRVASVGQIKELESALRDFLRQAMAAEEAGLEVTYKKISEFAMPEELQRKLAASPPLKHAFEALTPGRQRGYYIFISGAKQAKTREARVEKCVPLILKGKGLND